MTEVLIDILLQTLLNLVFLHPSHSFLFLCFSRLRRKMRFDNARPARQSGKFTKKLLRCRTFFFFFNELEYAIWITCARQVVRSNILFSVPRVSGVNIDADISFTSRPWNQRSCPRPLAGLGTAGPALYFVSFHLLLLTCDVYATDECCFIPYFARELKISTVARI